uniref:TLC domain-containing protein n=1 Tax=Timema shepardi TaxID=629360 RepID=A0A7R9AYF1_TIMSH|nr:unnamed protein product [Timema shepardi]
MGHTNGDEEKTVHLPWSVTFPGQLCRELVGRIALGETFLKMPNLLPQKGWEFYLYYNWMLPSCEPFSSNETLPYTYLHVTELQNQLTTAPHTLSRIKLPSTITPEPALRDQQFSLYLAVPPSSPPPSYVRMRTTFKHHVAGAVKRTDQDPEPSVTKYQQWIVSPRDKWKQSLLLPASFLLVSVLGSIGMAAGSVVILAPEDRISIARGAWLSLLGLVFFVSLFDLLNYVALRTHIGHMFRKKYELTLVEVLDISNKTVSAVQALLSCVTGSVVCIWSCTRNFLRSSHFMSEAYAWFGAAYFFYDIWSMYRVHTSSSSVHSKRIARVKDYLLKQPMIVLHHLLIGSFGFLVIVCQSGQAWHVIPNDVMSPMPKIPRYLRRMLWMSRECSMYLRGSLGDCVFGFVYLMELSTPFVSFRGILSKLKFYLLGPWCSAPSGASGHMRFIICSHLLSMLVRCERVNTDPPLL